MTTRYQPRPLVLADTDQCSAGAFDRSVSRCGDDPAPNPDPEDPAPDPDPEPDDDDDPADSVTLPKDAFNKRIRQAQRSGEKALLKRFGVESVEALEAKLKGEDKGKGEDDKGKGEDGDDAAPKPLTAADIEALLDKREEKRREAEQQRAAETAQADALKGAAAKAGVSEAGMRLAMNLAKAELADLDADEREDFDAKKFFRQLVKDHPTLKGVKDDPADNGANANGEDGKGKPDPKKGKEKFDATKASAEDRRKRLSEIKRQAAGR